MLRFFSPPSPARAFALLLLGLSWLLSFALPSMPAHAQATVHTPENPYGVNLFLHKEVEEWKIDRTLQMVAEANIPWVKQEFSWQELEFKKGYFYDDKWNKSAWDKFDRIVDGAEKYKLNLIARVDHAPQWAKGEAGGSAPLKDNRDLADFIIALLDHYEGRIKYVQVWNEPNLAGEWVPGKAVDPRSYAEMMAAVYGAVKAKHPQAVILSAPMAITLEGPELRGNMNELDYWQGLYDAGIRGSFDIALANGYGLDQPPDAPPGPKILNFRRVELLRDVMVRNGDGARPIWINEYAWNASPETLEERERNYWRHVTPQQQADYTVAGVEYARKNWPWAGVISIWYFRQVGDIPPEKAEYYFGMVLPDFVAQPVYEAVKSAALKLPGPAGRPGPLPTPTPRASTPTPRPPASPTARAAVPATPVPTSTATAMPTATAVALDTPTATATPAEASPTPTAASTATPTAKASPTSMPTSTATQQGAATPQATPTFAPPSVVASEQGANPILFVVGGGLVIAGLASLGYYLMRRKTT